MSTSLEISDGAKEGQPLSSQRVYQEALGLD